MDPVDAQGILESGNPSDDEGETRSWHARRKNVLRAALFSLALAVILVVNARFFGRKTSGDFVSMREPELLSGGGRRSLWRSLWGATNGSVVSDAVSTATTVASDTAGTTVSTAATVACDAVGTVVPNTCPNLEPPKGIWRGSTMPPGTDPNDFQTAFNTPLHIYRTFHYPGNWEFSAQELAFIQGGGIVFYSAQPDNWGNWAESNIQEIATAIKGVAPAQVYFAMGYEPDGHTQESADAGIIGTSTVYGTAAEFVALWNKAQTIFLQNGVSNAKWILDFSTRIATSTASQVPALWPGDGKVNWLAWNIFQNSTSTSCSTVLEMAYRVMEQNSVSGAQLDAIPWALGAWGSFEVTSDGSPIQNSSRQTCLTGVLADLQSGQYPRIKASVYFNSDYSVIMPSGSVSLSSPYTNSPYLMPQATQLQQADVFQDI